MSDFRERTMKLMYRYIYKWNETGINTAGRLGHILLLSAFLHQSGSAYV